MSERTTRVVAAAALTAALLSLAISVWTASSVARQEERLRDLAEGKGPARHLVTLGYAGWAPGQLEFEISRGHWHWVSAEPDFIFDAAAAEKWKTAYARRGVDL